MSEAVNRIQSMLCKADTRLMLSCFGHDPDMSDCRGAVYRKLKEKALDLGAKTLGIDDYKVAYNVKIISDKTGVRCDRRTVPKELQPWLDCPYDLPAFADIKELKHGTYKCVISYKMSGGTYEYPDECDLFIKIHRMEGMNNE